MFQSYSFSNDKIRITDSDFQETIHDKYEDLIEHIIEVYSKRNLNVAYNLVLYMQYENKNTGWQIDSQISRYKKYIKDFDKYLPEINQIIQEEQNQIQVVNDFLEENNLSKYKSSSNIISLPVNEFLRLVAK